MGTYRLTAGSDTFRPSSWDMLSGNDVFYATADFSFRQTLNDGDYIDGGLGSDKLVVSFVNSSAYIKPARIFSVETIEVVGIPTTGATLDLGNSMDRVGMVETVSLTGLQTPGATMTFTNVPIGLKTINIDKTLSGLTVRNRASVSSVTVHLSEVGKTGAAAPLSLGNYQTINLDSSGPATNFVSLGVGSPLTQVNLSGSADIVLNAPPTRIGLVVDASRATGNVSLTGTVSNDTFIFSPANVDGGFFLLNAGDAVHGGAGTDTVRLASSQMISDTHANMDGIEVLSVADPVVTSYYPGIASTPYVPWEFGGATTLELTAPSAAAYSVYFGPILYPWETRDPLHGTLRLLASNSGTSTLNGLRAGDSLSVVSGSATTGSLTHGDIVLTTAVPVDLVSNGAPGAVNRFGQIGTTPGDVLSLTLHGDRDLVLGKLAAEVVDASAFNGNLTMTSPNAIGGFTSQGYTMEITGGWGQDVLVGSRGDDLFQAGPLGSTAQGDLISGGPGYDRFRFDGVSQDAMLAMSHGTQQIVHITDFDCAFDKIKLHWSGTVQGRQVHLVKESITSASDLAGVYAGIAANIASIPVAASDSNNLSAALVKVDGGAYAGHTYLFVNNSSAAIDPGTDMLIDLTPQADPFGVAIADQVFINFSSNNINLFY